jgi:acyl transferase domain-containing protein/dienelactone hydrolase/acyl carrier protein
VAVAPYADRVSVAAINGPRSVVLSGDLSSVEAIASGFSSRGIRTYRLTVSHAFHSPRMDPMLGEFARVAESLEYRPATLALVSNLSGGLAGSEVSTPGYWVRHAREAVRFGEGVEALRRAGAESYLEIGPKSTLVGLVRGCVGEAPVHLLSSLRTSLRPGRTESGAVLEALGEWFTRGGQVDWEAVLAPGAHRVALPTYPWQRERYWIESSAPRAAGGTATSHPLLGERIPFAGADAAYETSLSTKEPLWLGAAVELMRAAAEDHECGAPCQVTGFVLQAPMVALDSGSRRVQVVLSDGGTRAKVYSQPTLATGSSTWTLHAIGELSPAPATAARAQDLESIRSRCIEPVDVASTHATFASAGIVLGPSSQALRGLWSGPKEALGEVSLDSGVSVDGYGLHPGLLDAALQSVLGALEADPKGGGMLPFELGRVVVHRSGATSAVVHVRLLDETSPDNAVANVTLMDESGAVIARVERVGVRAPQRESLRPRDGQPSGVMYRLDWQEVESAEFAGPLSGHWAVVAWNDGTPEQSLLEELRARGASADSVSIARLAEGVSADHVLSVWDESADATAALDMAVAGLSMSHALVSSKSSARLWWVTRASQSVSAERLSPSASSVWGLGRTLMQEYPELRCTLLDVESSASISEALAREVTACDEETQVTWRGDRRHVARLVRAAPAAPSSTRSLRVDGTVLVTGGLGALGLQVARGLAERGVSHLVLTGRRGLETPGAPAAVVELESLGARVTVSAVDVSDRIALSQVLSQVPPELPLRGVVHAAGVVEDGLLSEQTAERFARVIRPKAEGAWNLHELTAGMDLDLFVLFSSASGTLGSAGQSGYTAANAYLDGLAAYRRARGLAGLSLAWGAWAERGMAAALSTSLQARLGRQGLGLISAHQGLALFDQATTRPEAQLVLTPIDLRVAAKAFGAWVPPLWRVLVRAGAAAALGGWVREVAALPVDGRAEAVTHAVRVEVARVLGLADASAVAQDKTFKDLGMDSLMGVELRNALGRRAGVALPVTLAFDHPTPLAIAGYLLAEVFSRRSPSGLPAKRVSTGPRPVQHSLSSRDGLTIYGHLSLPPGPGPFPAIVVHTADPGGALGVDGRYANISEHAPLVAAGFAVFTVDQRGAPGHGDDYTRRNEVGGADVDDLVAAADYLAQRREIDSERLGIFGTSRGAYASLLAVQRAPHRWRAAALNMGFYDTLDLAHYRREIHAETSGINALGFQSWDDAIRHWSTREPQGLESIGRVAVPLFAIHGDADRIVPIEQALKLQDAARAAGIPFSLEVVPQMGHDFEQIHSAWPAIWEKVCAFFAKHLDRGGRPDHSAGSNGVGPHPPLHAIEVSGEI